MSNGKMSEKKGCLKVSGAAEYLCISPNTLRKYTDLGLIEAKRLPNGSRIYRVEWLDQFINGLPDGTESGSFGGVHHCEIESSQSGLSDPSGKKERRAR